MFTRLFFGVIVLLWVGAKAQQASPRNTYNAIISISAAAEEKTVQAIKKHLKDPSIGLSYLAYCDRQRCVILTVNGTKYPNPQQVFNYMENAFGDWRILALKNIALNEFFKTCSFADPAEYKYFKKKYGK